MGDYQTKNINVKQRNRGNAFEKSIDLNFPKNKLLISSD